MWRFRGSPHYLDAQASRLGLPKVLADRSRHNAEIYRVQVLLSQLCERFHRAPTRDETKVFGGPELSQVRGTLEQVELEVQKLHMLAAASAAMVDEAWKAFGLERARRVYEVMCEYDTAAPSSGHPGHLLPVGEKGIPPLGDGTVGVEDSCRVSC